MSNDFKMSNEQIASNIEAMNDDQKKIVEMRQNGASYKLIMSETERSQQYVYKTLFLAGITSSKKSSKVTAQLEEEICSARKNGATYMQLSVIFSLSTPYINKILRRNGLTKSK